MYFEISHLSKMFPDRVCRDSSIPRALYIKDANPILKLLKLPKLP